MNRTELRHRLKAQRAASRQALGEARLRARLAAASHPAVRRARRAQRLRRALVAALVVFLLSLIHCECGPAAPPEPVDAGQVLPPPRVKPLLKPLPAVKPGKLTGSLEPQARPRFVGQGVATPTWVDEFRLQVSARSPRLARCFIGVQRPGALRWVSSVNPASGAVSDHELEPIGGTDELTAPQRECLIAALSSPVYRLTEPDAGALADRVSLVIEF